MSAAMAGYSATAVTLLLAIGLEAAGMLLPTQMAATPVSPVRLDAMPAPAGTEVDQSQGLAETVLARPIFNEGRRPTAPPGTPAAAPADRPRLVGIITGPFPGCAILLMPGSAKQVALREGGRFNNLVVRSIMPEHVVVEIDGAAVRLVVAPLGVSKPPART